jgi:hypothetical protein
VAEADEIDKSVRLIRIVPSLGMFISCANVGTKSFVLRALDKTTGGSEFSVPKVLLPSFNFSLSPLLFSITLFLSVYVIVKCLSSILA